MRYIIAALSIALILFFFTFNIDGEIGIILDFFMIFAPLTSLFFAWYGRKRIRVTMDCDGYVQKGSRLAVNVTVEKTGRFPLGIVCIETSASEVFAAKHRAYKLSLFNSDSKTFTYELDAHTGGNGEVKITSVRSGGFLGFISFPITEALPGAKSVGVIPEVPKIKASSKIFRDLADSVMTSDEDENDAALLYSSNTAPGYEHREYVQGDPLKRVNWKLSAKKDRLMVRLDEAVASVQPVIALDLFRSPTADPKDTIAGEEQLIVSVFGLLTLMVNQGIASTIVYYSADGQLTSESVDNPEYPPQLLLKVLAARVVPDRRIKLLDNSACACVIATTEPGAEIGYIVSAFENRDSLSLICPSPDCNNLTDLPMWYLDGDNNFKQV